MGSWQFGGGAVEDPAEHQIDAVALWATSAFDTSQYFTLPPPPIPPSVGITRSYIRREVDLYAEPDRDAFQVSMGLGFRIGALNRRHGPIPAGSRVAIHQGRNFGKSRLASLEVGRALRNVYEKFRSHGFAKTTDLAESLKSQPKEFLLLTTPAIRDRYAAALEHPQSTRDRLGAGRYSYGAEPDTIDERWTGLDFAVEQYAKERRPLYTVTVEERSFQWQELPPVLNA